MAHTGRRGPQQDRGAAGLAVTSGQDPGRGRRQERRMTLTDLLAPLLLLAAAPPPPAPTAPPDLVASFRARDQALLDAIAPGDKKVWDAALAPEAVYLDENGRIIERAAFMDELKPLGPGASGHLDIVDYRLRIVGEAARGGRAAAGGE